MQDRDRGLGSGGAGWAGLLQGGRGQGEESMCVPAETGQGNRAWKLRRRPGALLQHVSKFYF